MIKKFTIIVLFLTCTSMAFAQNRLREVMNIKPGENYPTDMPNIYNWLENSLGSAFLSDLQFSQSLNNDGRFLSFAFHSRAEYTVKLPGAEGFVMHFAPKSKTSRGVKTQIYNVEARNDVKSFFSAFSPVNLNYSGREYFDYTIKYARIDDGQLVANTLNFMVKPADKKSKIKTFTDDINTSMKMQLAYPAEESAKGIKEMLSASGKNTADIIFDTYIANEDKKQESKNLNTFFKIIIPDGVENHIDKMRLFNIKAGMEALEKIVLPSDYFAFAKTPGDSLVAFDYRNFEASLDYKKKVLEIRFMGKFSKPARLIKGKEWKMDFNTGKNGWQALTENSKVTELTELIVRITETTITIEGSHNGYLYQLLENTLQQ